MSGRRRLTIRELEGILGVAWQDLRQRIGLVVDAEEQPRPEPEPTDPEASERGRWQGKAS